MLRSIEINNDFFNILSVNITTDNNDVDWYKDNEYCSNENKATPLKIDKSTSESIILTQSPSSCYQKKFKSVFKKNTF